MLSKNRIIDITRGNVKDFNKKTSQIDYEMKGIFRSEMLLFVSMAKYFGAKKIIESGRARAYSTEIIASFFNTTGFKIVSVECNKYSKDSFIAGKKLYGFKNLKMIFGDSFEILPKLTDEACFVLIDGPKTEKAIKLAIKLLKNKNVKAVFIHDVYKSSFLRPIIENLFNYTFFSDDIDFVKEFSHLDDNCWKEQARYPESKDWKPYFRDGKWMDSYSSTLGVIFNGCNYSNRKEIDKYLSHSSRCRSRTKFYLSEINMNRIINYIKRRFYIIFDYISKAYWFITIETSLMYRR